MDSEPVWIGIDLAKEQLDVAVGVEGPALSVSNDEPGISALVGDLRARPCGLVVLGPTGGFETPVTSALAAAALPVVVINPRHARDFARPSDSSPGPTGSTPGSSRCSRSGYGPEQRRLADEEARLLDALLTRRRQILTMIGTERNRQGFAPASLKNAIEKHIRWLQRELDKVHSTSARPSRPAPSGGAPGRRSFRLSQALHLLSPGR